MVGAAIVLQALAEFGGPMSRYKASLPQYEIVKGKVEIAGLDPDRILQRVRDTYAAKGRINTDDGLKIDLPDSWVHLRKSNTEPIIRIIAEAPARQAAEDLVRRFTNEIRS